MSLGHTAAETRLCHFGVFVVVSVAARFPDLSIRYAVDLQV